MQPQLYGPYSTTGEQTRYVGCYVKINEKYVRVPTAWYWLITTLDDTTIKFAYLKTDRSLDPTPVTRRYDKSHWSAKLVK